MEITWDTSVSSSNQALIQAAIDECLFDFAYIPTVWTVRVTSTAGHGGKFEAVTMTSGPGQPAQTDFAPGLFIPGDPLYVDEAFVKECVIHELGHVVTLANLSVAEQEGIAILLGIDYASQWSIPLGGDWTHAGQEAAAEVFKDLTTLPRNRHFLNRTNLQLPRSAHWYFLGACAQALESVTYLASRPYTSAGSLVVEGVTYQNFYIGVIPPGVVDPFAGPIVVEVVGTFFVGQGRVLYGGGRGSDMASATTDALTRLVNSGLSDPGRPAPELTVQVIVVLTEFIFSGEPGLPDIHEITYYSLPFIQDWPYADTAPAQPLPMGEVAAGGLAHGVVR